MTEREETRGADMTVSEETRGADMTESEETRETDMTESEENRETDMTEREETRGADMTETAENHASASAAEIFKALGDESRLAILRILLEGEAWVELIASRLNLTSATVSHHLKKLEAAGLVGSHRTQFYIIYSVRRDALNVSLLSLIGTAPRPDDDERYRRQILDAFFEFGRLKQLPAQRKKREIILRCLLDELDPDRDYPEQELTEHIARYYDDYCLIRRECIAFGLLERKRSPDGKADLYRKTE